MADVPSGANLSFHLSRIISDHRKNLGRVGKIETLPILQICPRPSQTIRDIYDFEFSLVGKIWDSRETVKSSIVWDFPDIWKPGLKIHNWLAYTLITYYVHPGMYMYMYQPKNSIKNLWKIKKLENIIWNWFAVEVKRCSWVNKIVLVSPTTWQWELAKAADLFIA